MASDPTDATSVLRSIWQQTPTVQQELDEECSPTKVCRNMKDVTFDGYAEDGGDIRAAWRNTLAREGKLTGTPLAEMIDQSGT